MSEMSECNTALGPPTLSQCYIHTIVSRILIKWHMCYFPPNVSKQVLEMHAGIYRSSRIVDLSSILCYRQYCVAVKCCIVYALQGNTSVTFNHLTYDL